MSTRVRESSLTLRAFQPRTLRPKTVLVFFGKRGSGKSFALQDVAFHMRRHFQEILVMSATEDGNHTWGAHVPNTFVHTSFKPDVLARTMTRQRAKFQAWQAAGARPADLPHLLIVAEDLMAEDKKCVNNPDMRAIFMNGRHIGITFAMTVQYLMDLPRALRMNIDYAFVMQDRSIGNISRMHEAWAGTVCELPAFRAMVQQCTQDKGAMVIDINSDSGDVPDVIYWYKARDHGAYRLGCASYWAFHFRYGAGGAGAGAGAGAGSPASSRARNEPTVRLEAPRDDSRRQGRQRAAGRRSVRRARRLR